MNIEDVSLPFGRRYVPNRDGQSFFIAELTAPRRTQAFTVVVNWPALVK